MPVAFKDILRTTGSQGQRKGLEPYADHVVSLRNFKIEERGRGKDKDGNDREKRRVLTADVFTDGLKPRRALMPKRIATRFIEAIELKADEDDEPFEVKDVLIKVGEHGATLHDPNDFPKSEGGWADEPARDGQNSERRGRGRPKREHATENAPELAAV